MVQPDEGNAILVTRYLERSWQYRRLLMRIPPEQRAHRDRLLDAMASLLVDLHRNGVFWGDCSLANTLFSRDGQVLQAWLVDAETSEIHPQLSDGQRQHDVDILVENVAGGLVDLAARLGQPDEMFDALVEEAASVATRYQALWDVLHAEPVFPYADRFQIEGQIRRIHELGFAVDEVNLQFTGEGHEQLQLKLVVAARRFHATQLQDLTGLTVGEGQARILLADLRAYQGTPAAGGAHHRLRAVRRPALARRGAHPGHGAGAQGDRRRRRAGPGVLRPARGALAAQREGRCRRRRLGRAGGAGGPVGAAGLGREDDDRGGVDRPAARADRRRAGRAGCRDRAG